MTRITTNIGRTGLIAVALLLTGCTGVSTNSETLHPTATEIEESGLVEWTIDENLSRDDVGMADGRDWAIYDGVDRGEPYRIRLTLPEGVTVEQSVKYVAAFARSDSGPPCSISFNHSLLPVDEAEVLLAEYQETFGLDGEQVAQWRDRYDSLLADGFSAGQPSSIFFTGPGIGDVQPTVETNIDRADGAVLFHIDLNRC